MSERPYDKCIREEQENLALEVKYKARKEAQFQQELQKRFQQSLELHKKGRITPEAVKKHWCTACKSFTRCAPNTSPPNPAFESECGGISWQQDTSLEMPYEDINIVDWIAAHTPGAEWPPFCEHCGKVLEPIRSALRGINCHCRSCTTNKISHIEYVEHLYCDECFDEMQGVIHDALATFLVYDPETGKKVK